jgi:hypothetical protein
VTGKPRAKRGAVSASKYKAKRQAKRQAKGKPKNPTEARAWLRTIDEHIRERLEEYRAHKPPVPAVGPLYAQLLADMRRLGWFVGAVEAFLSKGNKKSPGLSEENKKSLGRFLGLEKGPGNPGGRRKSGESVELARQISAQRETKSETRKTRQGKPAGTRWKEVGRDHGGMSDQAARKRAKRASLVRAEDDAKESIAEFVARLKQRLEQKQPPIGKAKARNEERVKKIRAHNRRKR